MASAGRVYYKEDLDRVADGFCQDVGCSGCHTPIYHHSCCEMSPPKVMYAHGSLFLICRKCGEYMSEIVVATKPVESDPLSKAN